MTVMVRETDHLKHRHNNGWWGKLWREREREWWWEGGSRRKAELEFISKWFAASFTCDALIHACGVTDLSVFTSHTTFIDALMMRVTERVSGGHLAQFVVYLTHSERLTLPSHISSTSNPFCDLHTFCENSIASIKHSEIFGYYTSDTMS
jgi:hypothetical protein